MNTPTLTRAIRRGDVACRVLDGDAILLSAAGRRIHRLNASALLVWELIGDGATVDELTSALRTRVDAQEHQLRRDVRAVLGDFERGALLRSRDENLTEQVRARDHGSARSSILSATAAQPTLSLGPFPVLESLVRVDFVGARVPDEIRALFADLARVLKPLTSLPAPIDIDSSSLVVLSISAAGQSWSATRNGKPVATSPSIAVLRRVVLAEVNAGPIEELSHSVGFHAGAVEFPEGVVVFPGVSNAGKSTLVANLMLRGHGYLTDEAAAIDVASQEVLPFAKSLCIDPGAQVLFPELAPHSPSSAPTWDIDPAAIGLGRLGSRGKPVAFVFPIYRSGASVRLQKLSASTALTRLLENSFDFSATGAAGADLLLDFAAHTPCFELSHGGQSEHLDVLDRNFGVA